jgi:hypothetical protein
MKDKDKIKDLRARGVDVNNELSDEFLLAEAHQLGEYEEEKNNKLIEGYYNSTYGFVEQNNLEVEASKCFGENWEAEDDVNQIDELLKFLNIEHFEVSLIEGKDEDDILVSYSLNLQKIAELEKENKKLVRRLKEILMKVENK